MQTCGECGKCACGAETIIKKAGKGKGGESPSAKPAPKNPFSKGTCADLPCRFQSLAMCLLSSRIVTGKRADWGGQAAHILIGGLSSQFSPCFDRLACMTCMLLLPTRACMLS